MMGIVGLGSSGVFYFLKDPLPNNDNILIDEGDEMQSSQNVIPVSLNHESESKPTVGSERDLPVTHYGTTSDSVRKEKVPIFEGLASDAPSNTTVQNV